MSQPLSSCSRQTRSTTTHAFSTVTMHSGILNRIKGVLKRPLKGDKASGDSQNDDATHREVRVDRANSPLPDSDYVCSWCSGIALVASCKSSKGYSRKVLPKELLGSQCRICRLLASAISPQHHETGRHTLSWSAEYGDIKGVSGTILLILKKGARVIPIATIVQENSLHFPTILRKLHPKWIDTQRITSWLEPCDLGGGDHFECVKYLQYDLKELRVLECTTRRIVAAPRGASYLALSYVWGKSHSPAHEDGLPLPPGLPQTIEDSIALTLRLGYQYLWIDRYVSRPRVLGCWSAMIDTFA